MIFAELPGAASSILKLHLHFRESPTTKIEGRARQIQDLDKQALRGNSVCTAINIQPFLVAELYSRYVVIVLAQMTCYRHHICLTFSSCMV